MVTDLRKTLDAFFHRWEITWSFYVEMENDLAKKLSNMLIDIRKDEQKTDPDLLHQYHEIDRIYTNLFREGLLIQICSLVEFTMGQVCTLLITQYEDKYNKRKGNWLIKNLGLLKRTGTVKVEPDDVMFFCDFITLRNCFVHSSGKTKKYRYQEQLKKAINNLQKLGKKLNSDITGESKDGYILLGVDALAEVVVRGEEIIRAVFEFALEQDC